MKKSITKFNDGRSNLLSRKIAPILISSLILSSSILATACGSDAEKRSNTPESVDTDESNLSKRVDLTQIPVSIDAPAGQLKLIDSFTALQVANLTAPTIDGVQVQANDVLVNGTATYVAYNYAGDPYIGGIDLLDIALITTLKLTASLALPTTDVNGLAIQGTNLYAVGASSTTGGGILKRIALSGSTMTSSITDVALPSYAGTDIATNASTIYTTSGDTGALSVFNLSTLALNKATTIADARSVGITSDTGLPMVLSGQPGKVSVMTAAGDLTKSYALGGATTAQSKSNLYVGSKWSVASLGEGGFKIFCNSDGTVIATVPQVTIAGVAPAKTVTNSVTASNGVIYTANGEAGVYVYFVRESGSSTCGAGSVTSMGSLNWGTSLSANAVYASGLNLFVADGLGGLRILTTITTVNVLSPLTSRL